MRVLLIALLAAISYAQTDVFPLCVCPDDSLLTDPIVWHLCQNSQHGNYIAMPETVCNKWRDDTAGQWSWIGIPCGHVYEIQIGAAVQPDTYSCNDYLSTCCENSNLPSDSSSTQTPSRLTSSQIPSINETPLDCDDSLCCCHGSDVCDVPDVSYSNNEPSGRSCESVRGLVDSDICPVGLAAQCPKTCGQCPGSDEITCVDDNEQIKSYYGQAAECSNFFLYNLCGQIHGFGTIADICPFSCNLCDASITNDPTKSPTSTAHPSIVPTVVSTNQPSLFTTAVSTTSVILDRDPTSASTRRPSIVPTVVSTTSIHVPSTTPVSQAATPIPTAYPTTSLTDDIDIQISSSRQPTTVEIETTMIKTRDIALDGDYDIVIGSNKDSFLQECSESLSPVSCVDVAKGSIIVTIQGSESEVNEAISDVEQNGLSLQSFGTLQAQISTTLTISSDATTVDEDGEGIDIAVIGGAAGGVVVLLLCCCLAYWYFMVYRMKHEVSWMDEDHVVTIGTEKRNLKQLKPSQTQQKYLEDTQINNQSDNGMLKTPLSKVRTFTTDDDLISYQRKTLIQETSVGGLLIDGPELPEKKHAPEPYGLGANLAPNAFHKKFLAADSWMTEGSSESVSMRVDMQNIQKRYPGISRLEHSGDDLLSQTGSLPKTRSFGGDSVLVEDDFQKRMPNTRSFGGDDLQLPATTERYQDSSPI